MHCDLLQILIVDDNPHMRTLISEILRAIGVRHVFEAGDGAEALQIMRANPIDIVMTDLGMPRMDGRQVAQEIKMASAATPVILLTGWGGIMQAEGTHPEHIDVVLGKPPQVNELMAALHKVAQGGGAGRIH